MKLSARGMSILLVYFKVFKNQEINKTPVILKKTLRNMRKEKK